MVASVLAGCSNRPPAAFSHRSEAQRTKESLSDIGVNEGAFPFAKTHFNGRTAHTKCGLYLLSSSLAAALLNGLFEHPAWCTPVIPDVQTCDIPACPQRFSAAC